MIRPKKINAVILAVRDIEKSLAWYKEHFGFEKLYDVQGGVLIGADGVELVLSQANDPENARKADEAKDICIRLFAFEVTQQDLERAEEEFPKEADLVRIDHPQYRSYIIEDPDGHSIELYVDKIVNDLVNVQQYSTHFDKYYAFVFAIDYAPCIICSKGCNKRIHCWINKK